MTMEVLVKIKKFNIEESYEVIEFVSKDFSVSVKDSFTLVITSIHDLLFGESKLIFKSKFYTFRTFIGVVIIKNLLFHSLNKVEHVLLVRDKSFINRIERYSPEAPKSIGSITIEFEIIKMNKEVSRAVENGFVKKIFNYFVSSEETNLYDNLKNVLAEAAKGTNMCRFKIVHGASLIESYLSFLNEKNTKNIDFNSLSNRKVCVTKLYKNENFDENIKNEQDKITIIKTNKTWEINQKKSILSRRMSMDDNNTDSSLEYFILGKSYEIVEMGEYLKATKLNSKFQVISTKKGEESWSFLGIFGNILKKKSQIENTQDGNIETTSTLSVEDKDFRDLEEISEEGAVSSMNQIEKINEDNQKIHREDEDFIYCFKENQYNLKKILKPNNLQVQHFHEIMSNDGYSICGKSLLEGIYNFFYYSISSYGNTWPTFMLQRRFKAENKSIESNRKAILEFLGIKNDYLLVISSVTCGIPDYIIFFEKKNRRIVVSFKGTTTSNEVLHDLDCGYGSFYEGFAHNGIKNLASSYVEKKIDELLKLCSKYDTKNILLTGHSLGGSVSILVHMILSKDERLKNYNIHTLAFSAAPVVSYNLALEPFPNIFVVNYGNDLISRLSYGSVCESKYLCCSVGYDRSFQPMNETKKELSDAKSSLNKDGIYPKLYFPGQVYNLKRIKVIHERKNLSLVLYKRVDLNFYEDVLILKHATLHHMPRHIVKVLAESIKDFIELEL